MRSSKKFWLQSIEDKCKGLKTKADKMLYIYIYIAKCAKNKVINLYMISMRFESTKAKRFVVIIYNFAFLFIGFLNI